MPGRFRAEHVGSLLRPAALLAARTAHANGQIRLEALRQAEDSAVRVVGGLLRQHRHKLEL